MDPNQFYCIQPKLIRNDYPPPSNNKRLTCVFTFGTIIWILLSFSTFLLAVCSVLHSTWLVGVKSYGNPAYQDTPYIPSIGPLVRCTRRYIYKNFEDTCVVYVNTSNFWKDQISYFWTISRLCLFLGFILIFFATFLSVTSICAQTCCSGSKSLFTMTGVCQGFAGLFFILGITFFTAGWSSIQIRMQYCGEQASYFLPGTCTLGWAFYSILATVVLCLVCAVTSVCADKSATSLAVLREKQKGDMCICSI